MQREFNALGIRNTYPDEYIEHWGSIYLANPGLERRRVLFAMFLVAPEVILAAHMNTPAPESLDPLPLLPQQRRAAAGIFMGQPTADHDCAYRNAFDDLEK